MSQRPSEPTDRNALHPDSDEGHRIATSVNAIIAVGEGKGDIAEPTRKQAIARKSQKFLQPPIPGTSFRQS